MLSRNRRQLLDTVLCLSLHQVSSGPKSRLILLHILFHLLEILRLPLLILRFGGSSLQFQLSHMVHPPQVLVVYLLLLGRVGLFEDFGSQGCIVSLLVHKHPPASHWQTDGLLPLLLLLIIHRLGHRLQLLQSLLILYVLSLNLV